jgi:hypothetical protein
VALRRLLSTTYGDNTTLAIVSTINSTILATGHDGDDSNLCSFVAEGDGDLSFRVSLPAVFPVPFNVQFALAAPLALPVDLSTAPAREAFAIQAAALGAIDMAFLLADPVFQLWCQAVARHPLAFAASSVRDYDFLSLPFVDAQEAALATTHLLMVDNLAAVHGFGDLMVRFRTAPSQAYHSDPGCAHALLTSHLASLPSVFTALPRSDVRSTLVSPPALSSAVPPIASAAGAPLLSQHHIGDGFTAPPAPAGSDTSSFFQHVLASVAQPSIFSGVPGFKDTHRFIRQMGLIDFVGRKGSVPFLSTGQDFELIEPSESSPTGVVTPSDKSFF